MTNSARTWLILGLLLAVNFAVPTMAADSFSVNKNVDRYAANHSDLLTYSISVANTGFTAVTIGLFSDEFPDEVTGCTWTCSATGSGWCDHAGGTGDVEQLLSVPVGSTATVVATCVFVPYPGHECAVNVAEFFTMDPDTFNRDTATTCEMWVVILFDDFESGNTSSWSETVP